jgi:DNA-binding CsgD family transcriptional regulator
MMASKVTVKQPQRELVKNAPHVSVSFREGVILLDRNFVTMAMDCGAQAILDDLKNGHGAVNGDHRLPQQLRSALEVWCGSEWDGTQLSFSVGGQGYSCHAFMVRPETGAAPLITLYLRRELSLMDTVQQIASEYHLTGREQEALMGISMGLTSKEVAAQMDISPNTVKAFLRLIMIKMGAGSRAGLVAKLLDQNGLRSDSQVAARSAGYRSQR